MSWLWSQRDTTWAHFLEGLIVFLVMLLLSRFVQPFSRNQLKRAHLDAAISLLASRLIYVAWMISAVIVFLSVWLSNLTFVLGSFGVFALAFGLAFQDILKNFLAGIFLLLERPFRIGDEIMVDGRTGIVEDVQFRTTTMRTMDGEEVLVPNSIVFSQTIVNRTRYPARQFALTVKVPAGGPAPTKSSSGSSTWSVPSTSCAAPSRRIGWGRWSSGDRPAAVRRRWPG